MKLYLSVVLLFALCLARSASAQQTFAPTYNSMRQAMASGQGKEYMAAMEALGAQAESNERWVPAAAAYYQASSAAWFTGQLQKSITYATKALELAQKGKSPRWEIYSMMKLATGYGDVRQSEKAREWLNKALEVTKSIKGDKQVEGNLYIAFGEFEMRQREYVRAIEHLSNALAVWQPRWSFLNSIAGRRNVPQPLAYAQDRLLLTRQRLGRAYQLTGNFSESIMTLEPAMEILAATRITTSIDTVIMATLGRDYLDQKDYPRALEYLTKALDKAEARQHHSAIPNMTTAIAQLFIQTGRPAEALPYFKKAIDSIESTRSFLQSEELRTSFFENKGQTYGQIIQASLRSGNVEEAFNYNERARSRAFLDILGSKVRLAKQAALIEEEKALQRKIDELRLLASLRNEDDEGGERPLDPGAQRRELESAEKAHADFLAKVRKENKEQASLMNVEPLTLTQLQELLDPGVTVLEYFVANNAVWSWVIEKDRLRFASTAMPRNALLTKVTAYRESISQLEAPDKLNRQSEELYKALIEPALPHIRGKELLIIPHDALHYLPFQALRAPDGQYLTEKYPINYLSSASLMQFTQEKRKAKGDLISLLAKGGKVLTFGNPDLGDPKMALQFAGIEAKEIKSLYPQSTIYLEKEATEEKAKALVGNSDIVHFASHAELSEDDPLASAILLAKSEKEDGRLEVREIFGMDLKASLVVLSACETGLGKLSSGDELVGLTRAFIYAGTPSVVASLWNVEDSSTAQLMASFYKNLQTMTKVEALRQAQLNLIRGNVNSDLLARRGIGGVGKLGEVPSSKAPSQDSVSISTSHPYFWAPFILVGEGK